ncbi:hypothetical protein GCM10010381_00090 [Streptomyces xantholiticus]|nr:hypothetical protein GCM10010381_00090 [Streptomyces xantholiticus]
MGGGQQAGRLDVRLPVSHWKPFSGLISRARLEAVGHCAERAARHPGSPLYPADHRVDLGTGGDATELSLPSPARYPCHPKEN